MVLAANRESVKTETSNSPALSHTAIEADSSQITTVSVNRKGKVDWIEEKKKLFDS